MIVNQPLDYAVYCQEMAIRMPCQHAGVIPHQKFKTGSNQAYYRLQCPDCGAALSSQLKYSIAENYRATGREIPPWNEELYTSWINKLSDARDAIRRLFAWNNSGWWDRYDDYLLSGEWRVIRARIMDRDNHSCRKCKERPATQVHHLTYERVGHEREEDLVAICRPCHSEHHARVKTSGRDGPLLLGEE